MSPNPAAGKKKPPPPPPPKKIGSFHAQYVTAMYDFDSHTAGDLSFREGDRIKVIKKTESSQDWWEGEVNGARGSFPANYCK
jgi:amphiphysin